MLLLKPEKWKEYELLDCGNFEKLERFGQYVTIRPEPQAVWDKVWSNQDWEKKAHVRFVSKSSSSGEWKKIKSMPDQWTISYQSDIRFRLGLTAFKHVGVFPEQATNWDFIQKAVKKIQQPAPKVLNLFAYTGGASLAAKCAGADVTHVDSI
ncbi:MAG TPA: oxidoreductase, partial [Bacteroidia bacterium]|nr:oxidoreductase [Bacteroidia bacterium]